MPKKVLVIGASGFQGGPVAQQLLESGYHVLAAGRNLEKLQSLKSAGAEPVQLDLNQPAQVEQAAKKADYAFFHAPMGLGAAQEGNPEQEALYALLEGGIEHLAYNVGFALPPEPVGVPQLDGRINLVEELRKGGRTTVFVPTGYLENFAAPWSAPKIAAGELLYPLSPEVKVSWVTNADIGRCTAAAFSTPESKGTRLRAAGPEALTLPEVAEQIGRAIGRKVEFRQISGNEYADILEPFVGQSTAQMIGSTYDRMANDQNPLMVPDVSETEQLLGVRFSTVFEWAKTRTWEQE